MLLANTGVSYDFILGNLPRTKYDVFVDASTTWGIGGCCGNKFFKYSWAEIPHLGTECIARKELFAALVALRCFSSIIADRLVVLYTDNSNVSDWLATGRSPKLKGLKFLAIWEITKFSLRCKVSPRWLPGSHNTSADKLSRGCTPSWLHRDGIQTFCNMETLAISWKHVEESWAI